MAAEFELEQRFKSLELKVRRGAVVRQQHVDDGGREEVLVRQCFAQ
jgi:hypothetical protein